MLTLISYLLCSTGWRESARLRDHLNPSNCKQRSTFKNITQRTRIWRDNMEDNTNAAPASPPSAFRPLRLSEPFSLTSLFSEMDCNKTSQCAALPRPLRRTYTPCIHRQFRDVIRKTGCIDSHNESESDMRETVELCPSNHSRRLWKVATLKLNRPFCDWLIHQSRLPIPNAALIKNRALAGRTHKVLSIWFVAVSRRCNSSRNASQHQHFPSSPTNNFWRYGLR